jgi:hypothetical protein
LNSEGVLDAAMQSFDSAKLLNAERIMEYIDVIILPFLDIFSDSSRSAEIGDL